MPGTLVDRLPLPNMKVYTAGSVLLLSIAVYYALGATSDPSWKLNATMQRQEAMVEAGGEVKSISAPPVPLDTNCTRTITEQFLDVMAFMMQEPLCLWTLINISYCTLALFGFLIQKVVFGQLRVAEAQRVKDKFWNYVFYKFIFVFGVVNVQYMDEVMLWCSWFTIIGFLHLLGQLCKDRYEYLSSSPNTARWAHVRLLSLVLCILAASSALLVASFVWGLAASRDTFAFMAAECVLLVVSALHVVARYALQMYEADVAGPVAYYTHLIFDAVSLMVELAHVVHMVVYSNMLVSMASLVLLMQLRHLLHELQARLRRHRLYTTLATHMSRNYPMASREEVEKNEDNCAICWEPMKEARKLPCSHLFHNSCLCQWVQQDASCPTCRRALAGPAHGAGLGAGLGAPLAAGLAPPAHPNHFFHFDGSRYVSWLPSFSVEVTRVRDATPAPREHRAPRAPLAPIAPQAPLAPLAPLATHALHRDTLALAQQVQQMFPQYPVSVLAADLSRTQSADATLENILEGRLAAHLAHLAHLTHSDQQLDRESSPGRATTETLSSPEAEPLEPARAAAHAHVSTAPTRRDNHHNAAAAVDSAEEAEEVQEADVAPPPAGFLCSAAARERALRRRKEHLVAAARARYLHQHATPAPHTSHATAAPHAAPHAPHATHS